MTPLQAILKNICLLVCCAVIYFLPAGWRLRRNTVFLSLAIASALLIPFVVNPIDYAYTSNNLEEKVNYPLELGLLYAPQDSSKVEVPSIDLRTGKHVLAFLSLSCKHCRIAAKKFRLIKKNNPDLPVYFVLNGDRTKYQEFIEDTRATNIPYSYCMGKSFVKLASTSLPRIYYLDAGIVVKKVDYFELSQYAIERWVATGKTD